MNVALGVESASETGIICYIHRACRKGYRSIVEMGRSSVGTTRRCIIERQAEAWGEEKC